MPAGRIQISRNWQYTEPVNTGNYFRLRHIEAPINGLFAIAQCEVDAQGNLSLRDSQILAVDKGISDVIKLDGGAFTGRRIAIKKINSQPNLEQEIRRLLLPNFLIPADQEINFIKRHNWQIDIEVSDYVESIATQTDYSTEFADITSRLTTIEQKIDSINTALSESPSTGSAFRSQVLALNPHFYWRLGETSGTIANDETANARNGTYTGAYTLNRPSSLAQDNNPSIDFSSTGKVLIDNQNLAYPLSALLRFKIVDTNDRGIIGFINSADGAGSAWNNAIYSAAGNITFYTFEGGQKFLSTPNKYNDGLWHTLVATLVTNGSKKIYIDGVEVATASAGSPATFSGYWHLGFAKWASGITADYIGSFDEFAIFNSELTASEISSLHTATL